MDPNASSNLNKSNSKVNTSMNRSKKPTTLAPLEGFVIFIFKQLIYLILNRRSS